MAAYYARTASPNDALIAGPSGAGYILPSKWPRSQLAPAAPVRVLMQRVGLQSVEILDTLTTRSFSLTAPGKQCTRANYARYSVVASCSAIRTGERAGAVRQGGAVHIDFSALSIALKWRSS